MLMESWRDDNIRACFHLYFFSSSLRVLSHPPLVSAHQVTARASMNRLKKYTYTKYFVEGLIVQP